MAKKTVNEELNNEEVSVTKPKKTTKKPAKKVGGTTKAKEKASEGFEFNDEEEPMATQAEPTESQIPNDTIVDTKAEHADEDSEVLHPITIKCIKCGEEFVMIPSEQKFFTSKGYSFPKRCPNCRINKANKITIKCVDCGATFEMDGREVDYYTRNNLNLPKRCKQCRQFKRERNKE